MKPYKFPLSLIACLTLLLSACNDYREPVVNGATMDYNLSFHREFPVVDLQQDFNLATRASITVTPSATGEVLIYANTGSRWTLVGHYSGVKGETKLGFDVPEGVVDLMVSDGITAVRSQVEATVTLPAAATNGASARTACRLNDGLTHPYLYPKAAQITSFASRLPEEINNRSKTVQDFMLRSTGEFVVYPTYWNTPDSTMVCLYLIDSNGKPGYYPLFANHGGNESLQVLKEGKVWQTLNNPCQSVSAVHSIDPNNRYRSKGIIVNLPVGTIFGFAYRADAELVADAGHTSLSYRRYAYHKGSASDAESQAWSETDQYIHTDGYRNPYYYLPVKSNVGNNFKTTAFAAFVDDYGVLNIGVEDHRHFASFTSGSTDDGLTYYLADWDFNDIVFKVEGAVPEVLDNAPCSWILSYEDLGGECDWDFNDAVLRLDYISGTPTATITPLAACTSLHAYVYFNDTGNEANAQPIYEVHNWLGAAYIKDMTQPYNAINTSNRNSVGSSFNVVVSRPDLFSVVGSVGSSSASGNDVQKPVGVFLLTSDGEKEYVSNYRGKGHAPSMLIVPASYVRDGYVNDWSWAQEKVDIRQAYAEPGHSFEEWTADRQKAIDWFMYPTKRTVTGRHEELRKASPTTFEPEYNLSEYGTSVTIPRKNDDLAYVFGSSVLDNFSVAVITLVMKNPVQNTICPILDGQFATPVGIWYRLNEDKSKTYFGRYSTPKDADYTNNECFYQIKLSAIDIEAIRRAGQFAITALSNSSVIAMSIAQGEESNAGDADISSDPASGSSPVLAPGR